MDMSTALIGVLAAISGKNLEKEHRTRALVSAMALGGQGGALSGFLVGQSSVDRSERDSARNDLHLEQARSRELETQAEAAFHVAQAFAKLTPEARGSLEKQLGTGDLLGKLTETFRNPVEVTQRKLSIEPTASNDNLRSKAA